MVFIYLFWRAKQKKTRKNSLCVGKRGGVAKGNVGNGQIDLAHVASVYWI